VYEDDVAYAFRDISPVAPVHVLVVPKVRGALTGLSSATAADKATLGHLFFVAAEVARLEGVAASGYRVVVNDGKDGCQSVDHLHLHVIGGKQLSWPPGTGAPEGSMRG
jgi:histidine triad (HIT) family protein